MSEQQEWSKTDEDVYEARSGQRLYRVSKDSSGLPERVWSVVQFGVDADGTNAEPVAQASAPTLEDAKQIAQGWESEYGLWPPKAKRVTQSPRFSHRLGPSSRVRGGPSLAITSWWCHCDQCDQGDQRGDRDRGGRRAPDSKHPGAVIYGPALTERCSLLDGPTRVRG